MARQAKPSYWESKRGYFCQINGERHPLAYGPKDEPHRPTFLKAMEAFIKLKKPAVPQPPAADLPLCECVQKWLENVQKYKSESYHETSEYVLNATPPKWEPHEVRSWRGRAISALLPHHVTGWLEGMTNWCGTTKRTAWERLVQCLIHVPDDTVRSVLVFPKELGQTMRQHHRVEWHFRAVVLSRARRMSAEAAGVAS